MRGLVASCACLLLHPATAAAATPAPPTLPSTLRQFDELRPDSDSTAVAGLKLGSDGIALVLESGHVAVVRAGEESVGLFFEGRGTLEYRSTDAIEFPIVEFNVRKCTDLKSERSGDAVVIRDTFKRLLWLTAGKDPLPEAGAKAVPSPTLAASFDDHLREVRRIAAVSVPHLFGLQRLNAPAPGHTLVLAYVSGGQERLVYVRDGVLEHSRALAQLRENDDGPAASTRWLLGTVLAEQPLGRERREPLPAPFLLTAVELTVNASKGKDVTIGVSETLVPQAGGQRVLRFNLLNRTWASAGLGVEERHLRLKSVSDESGRALPFDHRHNQLLVGLSGPAPVGQPVRLRFELEGDILERPGGDNFWMLGTGDWFPQPDLNGQLYTFRADVRVPAPFLPFAPGRTLARRSDGDYNVVETEVQKPIQHPVIVAGKYDLAEETRDGLTLRVATYAGANRRAMKQLTDLGFAIVRYYQYFLGPFPFPELNVIEVNSYGFGIGPAATVLITQEAFNPLVGDENQLFSQGINERFAHEIAHQYWGHAVKMPSHEEQWITEAFAEYSAALFLREYQGRGTYQSLVNHWRSRAGDAHEAAPIPLANRVWLPNDPRSWFRIRNGLLYSKGALLLAALHRELGDEVFLTFMKSYQTNFRWKFGSTRHVQGLLEFMTKRDYKGFFDAYYWGTAMPPK